MRALKALRPDAVGPFSGFRWPTPAGEVPGAWVDADPAPCASGVHACRAGQLPLWLQAELWEIELDGEISTLDRKLVAERGRLVRRVDAWDADALVDYGTACLGRLETLATEHPHLGGYAEDGRETLAHGEELFVALAAARAAELAGGPDAYDAERAWQAAWLAERLALAA